MSKIKVTVVPGNSFYQRHLVESLNASGVSATCFDANWGVYLPDLVDGLLAAGPDIVNLQWPESLMSRDEPRARDGRAVLEMFQAMRALKRAGIRLVWTLHNLVPHERVLVDVEDAVYTVFASQADGAIHHSHCGKRRALATYAFRGLHAVIRHGYHPDPAARSLTRDRAREILSLDADKRVYLCFGGLRPVKRIELLVEAMKRRRNDDELLLIVGRAHPEYGEKIQAQARNVPNIRLDVRETGLPQEELALHAVACDLLLFAHGRQHLTSGGPHLSQTYLRPQVTLDAPYAREVLGDGGIYFDDGGDAVANLSDTLDRITPRLLAEKVAAIRARRPAFSWRRIGRSTARFYEKVLSRAPGKEGGE